MSFTFYDIPLEDSEIKLICTEKREANPQRGHFPAYKFGIALLDNTVIGKCDLRVGHNENTYYGGNIGYSIDEPYRGHHYAAKACKLIFKLAAMHKLDFVIITCSIDNKASSRTCLLAGGMLIDETNVPKDSDLYNSGVHRVLIYKFLVSDMKVLHTLDAKDYDKKADIENRHSVRAIIIRDSKIAMAYVSKHGYYKFPGGGSDGTETMTQTLIRETREETGLVVKPESIKAFGMVQRRQQGKRGNIFCQDNFYFLCDAEDEIKNQELSEKEAEGGFTLQFVEPEVAIQKNREANVTGYPRLMVERETLVLEDLIKEGYFNH